MPRPQPLQDFLDIALPAMRAGAHDGNSPASLRTISEAVLSPGQRGADPASLPVVRCWASNGSNRTGWVGKRRFRAVG